MTHDRSQRIRQELNKLSDMNKHETDSWLSEIMQIEKQIAKLGLRMKIEIGKLAKGLSNWSHNEIASTGLSRFPGFSENLKK